MVVGVTAPLQQIASPRNVTLLGLDLGSTWFKLVEVDEHGPRHLARVPTPWRGSEIALDEVLSAVTTLLTSAVQRHRSRIVVGVAGMGDTAFLLDEQGQPIGTALGWFDRRGRIEELRQLGRTFSRTTGLPLTELCGAAKYSWLRRAREGTERGVCWLSLPDAVVHALTGQLGTEPTLATRTGFLDLDGSPATEVLEAVAAPSDLLPASRPAGTQGSLLPLSEVMRSRLGTPASIEVMPAGHDAVVAATMFSGTRQIMDVIGTAETVARIVRRDIVDVERVTASVLSIGHHHDSGYQVLQLARPYAGRLHQTNRRAGGDKVDRWLIDTVRAVEDVSGPSEGLVLGGGSADTGERARRAALLALPVRLAADQQVTALGAAHLAAHAVAANEHHDVGMEHCCLR